MREANTLGSKSAALELTNISVDMKVADRADARAGPEHRVGFCRCRPPVDYMDYPGNLSSSPRPAGRQVQPGQGAAGARLARSQLSISHTTRPPRGQEQHGREYYFVRTSEFDAMVLAGAFVEWA